MVQLKKCEIVSVGKRRDGGTRYWCLEHRADATAKYGRRGRKCRYSGVPPLRPREVLKIHVNRFRGGVAIWGAVPPIYDTTRRPVGQGVHVHARQGEGGGKQIDETYRAVRLLGDREGVPRTGLLISELDAIYYMAASVFGFRTKYIECTRCGFPHLDKDWFSLHPHRRHLCAGCGQLFSDADTAIGNPVVKAQEAFGGAPRAAKSAARSKSIRQANYPGGIRIWGSNPAILWTSPRREEAGIHLHALSEDGGSNLIDETFSAVTVDGISLDPEMVRVFMAQSSLPHLAERIVDVSCPQCREPHFDRGEFAFTPHEKHSCIRCGFETRSKGRRRKTIANPMVGILARLEENAPRPPQRHQFKLLPETL
jgi:predicted RNA-binding Zn-ribbon protein involved in translation (DUF1610 family)